MFRPSRSTTRPTKPHLSPEASSLDAAASPQTLLWAEGRGGGDSDDFSGGVRSSSRDSAGSGARNRFYASHARKWIWAYMARHYEEFWEAAADWFKWKICDYLFALLLMCMLKRAAKRPMIRAALEFLLEN